MGGKYLAQTPVRQTGCDAHERASLVPPSATCGWNTQSIKVAILFAYMQCRALAGEIVVSTCKTRKLIHMTLFML